MRRLAEQVEEPVEKAFELDLSPVDTRIHLSRPSRRGAVTWPYARRALGPYHDVIDVSRVSVFTSRRVAPYPRDAHRYRPSLEPGIGWTRTRAVVRRVLQVYTHGARPE